MELLHSTPLIPIAVGALAVLLLLGASVQAVFVLTPRGAEGDPRSDLFRMPAGGEIVAQTAYQDPVQMGNASAIHAPGVASGEGKEAAIADEETSSDENEYLALAERLDEELEPAGTMKNDGYDHLEPTAYRWWGINE
ncbi:MAG: hypothetical protein ABMA01_16005 [Chthoniobacteraceae bacterium]